MDDPQYGRTIASLIALCPPVHCIYFIDVVDFEFKQGIFWVTVTINLLIEMQYS